MAAVSSACRGSTPAFASKFAVEGLSEALSRDVAHLGVQVAIVEPGVFQTGLGESAVQPSRTIDAYAPAADQLPGLYDWTPGNLEGAAQTIVSIADRPDAPPCEAPGRAPVQLKSPGARHGRPSSGPIAEPAARQRRLRRGCLRQARGR
ncbi:SDR family NAD(P)-dependent oxidoreductase [Rhodococcus opacus]|uniref:SDR family NAD(P)-dependent oxidoreductase n=1 Tax=Rhodococcus opacus TaxID=37919 RepID=UPI0035AEBD97